jgi:hypothetical protein
MSRKKIVTLSIARISLDSAVLKTNEMLAISAGNTCWTYETLLLIYSLMMAYWCRNMYELASDMKCVLCSVLLCFNRFLKVWKRRKVVINGTAADTPRTR